MAETVGSLVDKITIVTLKLYHMREQRDRDDVHHAFREACTEKVYIMERQRHDLVTELNALLEGVLSGRVRMYVYRQFKMYNDPQYRRPTNA